MSELRFSAFPSQSIMYLILGCSCYKCDWLLLHKPPHNYICPLLLNYFYIKDVFHIFSRWKNIHLLCDCTQGTVTAVTHELTTKMPFPWNSFSSSQVLQDFSTYASILKNQLFKKKKAVKEDKQAHHSAATPQISREDATGISSPSNFLQTLKYILERRAT